jgi:hypothetical protein
MAWYNDLTKGDAAKGLAIGVGVAVLAPLVLPVVASAARPLARAAIKTGIVLYEKSRETVAEIGEVMEDLVAEARAELEQNPAAEQAAEVAEAVEESAAGPEKPV